MSNGQPNKILLLGGTGESAALASVLIDRFGPDIALTTSLAGRTETPKSIPGVLRVGGFGGIQGLRAYLRDTGIDLVIDATHPFAAQISRHAGAATQSLGLPLLRLTRPAWQKQPDDRWIEVDDTEAAARVLAPCARRIWLTIGTTELAPFAALADAWFLIRTIATPTLPPPLAAYNVVLGRGPFTLEAERALILENRIDALVTKASGGSATQAKLVAARETRIPVVMIRRPAIPETTCVETIAEAIGWVAGRLKDSR